MEPTSGYSNVVLEHMQRPRNAGVIENPDGAGIERNPVCGDILTLTLRVADGRIADVKQEVKGCTGSVAASSALTELVAGATLEQAAGVTRQAILDALGGLPTSKLHSAALAESALKKALAFYRARQSGDNR